MIDFRVEDIGQDGCRVSLRDVHGHLHVARLTGPAPEVGDTLFGQEALAGARVLVHKVTNKPVAVHFEALGCTQSQALDLLHPLPEAPAHPLPVAVAAALRAAAVQAGPGLD